jgi:hypothetical protein
MRASLTLILFFFLFVPFRSAQAQTCNANITASTPDSQFTENGDGTITDTATGLMWKKCLEGMTGDFCETGAAATFTWQAALLRPRVVNDGGGFAGKTDWRLPNIKELGSIVEGKCFNPAINLTRFPNTPSSVVWSGSPYADVSGYALIVGFVDGVLGYHPRDFDDGQVRLVRGGQ